MTSAAVTEPKILSSPPTSFHDELADRRERCRERLRILHLLRLGGSRGCSLLWNSAINSALTLVAKPCGSRYERKKPLETSTMSPSRPTSDALRRTALVFLAFLLASTTRPTRRWIAEARR